MEKKRSSVTNRQRQLDITNACNVEMERQLRGEVEKGPVLERVAQSLGISKTTVQRYWKVSPNSYETPRKRKKAKRVKDVDEFGRGVIQRVVYRLYSEGRPVTLDTVLAAVRQAEESGFSGGRTSLYTLLLDMGFKWKRTDGRQALLEDSRIMACRIDFLRQYSKLKEEGYSVFMDETWFYSKGFPGRTLQDGSLSTMKRKSIDKGKRYIVVHSGTSNGFVEGSHLVFSSKVMDGNYHNSFNSAIFEQWLVDQLLPSLEEPSVVVLDNAAYHSVQTDKRPTSSWKKQQILEWLERHEVAKSSSMNRADLLCLAQQHKPSKSFRIDELIHRAGHRILRLPPYHCHYNPIEMAWSDCKRYYHQNAGRGQRFDEEAVLAIWEEAIHQVTPEKWAKYVQHCDRLMVQESSTDERLRRRYTILPVIADLASSSDEDDPAPRDEDEPGSHDDEPLAVPLPDDLLYQGVNLRFF